MKMFFSLIKKPFLKKKYYLYRRHFVFCRSISVKKNNKLFSEFERKSICAAGQKVIIIIEDVVYAILP